MSPRQLAGAQVRQALAPAAVATQPAARVERVTGLIREAIANLRAALAEIERTRGR